MRRLLLPLLATAALSAAAADLDQDRSAWQYRRAVTLPSERAAGAPFGAVDVDPETAAQAQADLQDLRLVEANGRELPWVAVRADPRAVRTSWTGRLIDTRRERRRSSAWIVDLGADATFDRLVLDIPAQDFVKRFRVEAVAGGGGWKVLVEDAGVFDRPWRMRVHHTTIDLPETVTTRNLRLTADDTGSRPVDLVGVVASVTRRTEGRDWRRPVTVRPLGSEAGISRYRLDVPPRFPVETLELDADEAAFSRRVTVKETSELAGRTIERPLGEGLLYRLRLEEEALSAEMRQLDVQRPQDGQMILEIDDGDSPPLGHPKVVASGTVVRLVFLPTAAPITLYYGNVVTRAPVYDLQMLQPWLGVAGAETATLGPEQANPRFAPAPPLPLVADRGAALEADQWKTIRRVSIAGHEDLYAVVMPPEDLAVLRDDFGDLRVADEADKQVPFVLERDAVQSVVDLTPERQSPSPDRRATSRYRLRIAGPQPTGDAPRALPLAAVELSFREPYFTRPARLLVAAPNVRGGRVAWSGTLAHPYPRRGPSAPQPAPFVLTLDGARVAELTLEIDEGDNAPLTLTGARGFVNVPRIAFKAGPGGYRLLLGNADAQPPRYDIASLRQEVLAYSALPVKPGPAERNPAFRRRAGDYFKNAPPTVILWGALLVAVVVLLLLTARIVKQSPA
jgi:hypothetical protein